MLNSWAAVAAALPSQIVPEKLMQDLRNFYAKQSAQLVLLNALGLHDFTDVDESIALLIEHIIVIGIDTEAWTKNTDEMTEIGLAVFERKDMMEVHTSKKDWEKDYGSEQGEYEHLGDFGEELLKKITFHHLRIVETAHLRTNAKWMKGAEGNRFGRSCFVTFAEARDVLDSLFLQPVITENPELKGCYRPVVLIGHAMSHDHDNLKKKHGLQCDWNEFGTIVKEIDTQPLAKATNTWINPEAPANEVGLETLTRTLGFDHSDAHTACNDASRTLISAIQMVLPKSSRKDKMKDMQMVVLDIEKRSRTNFIPTWGSQYCCTRCGGRDHQDEDGQRCVMLVHCKACARFDPVNANNHWATHSEMYCLHVAEYKAWLRRYNDSVRKRKIIRYGPPEGSHPPSDLGPLVYMRSATSDAYVIPQSLNGRFFAQSNSSGPITSTYRTPLPAPLAGFQPPRYKKSGRNFRYGMDITRGGNGCYHDGNRIITDG